MQCIIHIGTEKTGTTLLQNWLFNNAKNLEAYGISMSRLLGKYNHRRLVSYFNDDLNDDFYRDRSILTEGQRVEFFTRFSTNFYKELSSIKKQGKTKYFIITSEHFHSRLNKISQIKNLKNFLDDTFSSIKVVGYFREQSQLRKSLYSTAIRVGKNVNFDNFHKNINTSSLYYNYYTSWSMWADVFGVDNLLTHIYDRNLLFENDIRFDFLNNFLSKYNREDFDWNLSNTNEGFSHIASIMGQSINGVMPRYNSDGSVNRDREFAIENLLQFKDLDIGKITDSQALSIYERFHESNCEFGRKFLGLDGNPFVRPNSSSDINGRSGDYDRLEAALQSFFGPYVLQLFEFSRR